MRLDVLRLTSWCRGRNIILVGAPGAGKSTVGRLLAERLSRTWADMDELFERHFGITPPEMAAVIARATARERIRAEEFIFRALPTRAGVISTGAGSPCAPISFLRLWFRGPIVWLAARPETIYDRLYRLQKVGGVVRWSGFLSSLESGHDPVSLITAKVAARTRYYSLADVRLDTDGLLPEETVSKLLMDGRLGHVLKG